MNEENVSIHLLSEVADDRGIKVHSAEKWNGVDVRLLHGIVAVLAATFTTTFRR